MSGQTLWEFLGVPSTCTVEELKAAWRKKAKTLHPDVNGGDERKTKLFVEAKALYEQALKWKEEQAKKPAPPPVSAAEDLASIFRQQQQQQSQPPFHSGINSIFDNIFGKGRW